MKHIQLNSTELAIIQFLFDHQDDYQPSKALADFCNVSDKTVRKYIRTLEDVLEEYGSEIIMKRGSGYYLDINDSNKFYHLLEYIREQNSVLDGSKMVSDNTERERYILNLILLENQLVTIDDLAEIMYISKSTVSAVIQLIKNRLKKFNLSVTYDIDGYITIEGLELEKRRFILNYFFSSQSQIYVNANLLNYKFEGFSTETIFIIVLEKCREFNIQLSDYVLQNLVLHIALAIKRNEKGFVINKIFNEEEKEYDKELFVAEKIVEKIEKLIDIEFPKDEAKYIALHLKSKSNKENNDQENVLENKLQTQIMTALLELQKKQIIHFSIDQQLMMGLKVHFEPLLMRLKNGLSLKNPLYEEITEKYPEVFNATKDTLSNMPLLTNYELDNHEWSYVSLHLLAAVERHKQNTKVNAIVICATGLGSAQMLKNRLENEFSTNLNIVDVISYYQLKDDMLSDVELIISTIDISTTFYNIPVVKVSVFLNKQDIETLNLHIFRNETLKVEKTMDNLEKNKIEQVFNLYFDEERFIVFESNTCRSDVLDSMIEKFSDSNHPSFYEDLMNQIHIREQFGSLAFTEQVAFPHPAQPVGVTSEIVVGLVPNGVVWDEEHDEVRIIILMSHSKIENKGLDMINSGLAELITDIEKVDMISKNQSFTYFKEVFMEIATD